MRISACIITDGKNTDNLQRCVDSIMNTAYEIIIGANNNSYEDVNNLFAENPKVKVFPQKWINHFSYSRNEVIDKATGDFILIIDSDEYLISDIKYLSKDYDLYYSKIGHAHNDSSLHGEFTDDMSIRVFKNIPEIRYENKIHETVEGSIDRHNLKWAVSDILIGHDGYTDEKTLKEKLIRNHKILLTDKNNPTKDYLFLRHYFITRDFERVMYHGDKVLTGNYSAVFKSIACVIMGILYKDRSEDLYRQMLTLALVYVPKQVQARWLLVNSFYDKKEYKAKKIIESQLKFIEEVTEHRSSDIPNDSYIKQIYINNIKGEIKKWQ